MADWNYYAAFYQTIGSPKYDLKTKGVGATVEELILWITGLKEFKATRKKADDAGMTDAQIDNAIAKLCTISLATTREGINAKLATYSNANVKSFLADILQNPCNTYNLNFGTSTGQTVNYPAGMEDYYVGLKSSNSFPTLKYEITITNTVEQPVSFTAGKIRFQQDYKIKSIPSKPSEDRTETYDETLHPFEPMKIIVANDYATLGLTKGTEVVLPSYMVMLLKNNIRRYNNQMVIRNISNALVMIGGIAAIPATAGGSIVAATSVIAASVSAVDIGVSVYRSNISVAEYNANKEYYDAWDGFYHTTTLANAVVSLPGTINTLRSVNIADKWQKLINIRKNSLKWNTLSSNGKALFQTLITEIGNRLGVVLTVGGIAFIQKTLSISTASAQEIAFLGAIAFVREIPLLAPISNTLTKTLLKTSSNAFKTDIATVNLTKNLLSASAPAVPARLVNTFDNTVLHLTSAGSAGSSSGLLPAEAALFTTPITSLAQTQTATQAFGIMQAWEIVGANAQKFYLLTFATQTASLLNVSNIPITGLIAATNAQGQAVNINTITVTATQAQNAPVCVVCTTRPTTTKARMEAVCNRFTDPAQKTNAITALDKICNILANTDARIDSLATRMLSTTDFPITATQNDLNTLLLEVNGATNPAGANTNFLSANIGNLNVPVLQAWLKLKNTNFSKNYEYLRTLVYAPEYNTRISGGVVTISATGQNSTKIWATFNGNTITATGGVGRNTARVDRNQILNIVPLIPNITYIVTNTAGADYVTYLTDGQGRVREISATLISPSIPHTTARRDATEQGKAKDLKEGVITSPVDDGGHMIASTLDGPVEQINYFPQNPLQNQNRPPLGEWYAMEEEWRNTTNTGTTVEVIIRPHFPSTTGKRPDWFDVTYTYGNNQPQTKTIQN